MSLSRLHCRDDLESVLATRGIVALLRARVQETGRDRLPESPGQARNLLSLSRPGQQVVPATRERGDRFAERLKALGADPDDSGPNERSTWANESP